MKSNRKYKFLVTTGIFATLLITPAMIASGSCTSKKKQNNEIQERLIEINLSEIVKNSHFHVGGKTNRLASSVQQQEIVWDQLYLYSDQITLNISDLNAVDENGTLSFSATFTYKNQTIKKTFQISGFLCDEDTINALNAKNQKSVELMAAEEQTFTILDNEIDIKNIESIEQLKENIKWNKESTEWNLQNNVEITEHTLDLNNWVINFKYCIIKGKAKSTEQSATIQGLKQKLRERYDLKRTDFEEFTGNTIQDVSYLITKRWVLQNKEKLFMGNLTELTEDRITSLIALKDSQDNEKMNVTLTLKQKDSANDLQDAMIFRISGFQRSTNNLESLNKLFLNYISAYFEPEIIELKIDKGTKNEANDNWKTSFKQLIEKEQSGLKFNESINDPYTSNNSNSLLNLVSYKTGWTRKENNKTNETDILKYIEDLLKEFDYITDDTIKLTKLNFYWQAKNVEDNDYVILVPFGWTLTFSKNGNNGEVVKDLGNGIKINNGNEFILLDSCKKFE